MLDYRVQFIETPHGDSRLHGLGDRGDGSRDQGAHIKSFFKSRSHCHIYLFPTSMVIFVPKDVDFKLTRSWKKFRSGCHLSLLSTEGIARSDESGCFRHIILT